MDVTSEIDRLCESGVRFSITIGPNGYIARLGNYAHETTPRMEAASLAEAVYWLRGHLAVAGTALIPS